MKVLCRSKEAEKWGQVKKEKEEDKAYREHGRCREG